MDKCHLCSKKLVGLIYAWKGLLFCCEGCAEEHILNEAKGDIEELFAEDIGVE